jgi:hypothetical protein
MSDVSSAIEPRALNAHLWARHPDDWYVEPEWCSERLFEVEKFEDFILDPACGLGRIVASATAAGYGAFGHDKVDRSGFCLGVLDFLDWQPDRYISTIVSNPPFGISREFAGKALEVTTSKVALLLPTLWLHGDERSRWLATTPLAKVLILTPRPSMPPGPVIEAGIAPGGGKADFAWFIWEHGFTGSPTVDWLRKKP